MSSPTPRRLVIAGLGNYTHPLTRHSIGQLLLLSLALKASSHSGSTGSSTLLLNKKHPALTTTITLPSPSTSPQLPPLQLLFVLPRLLMNISGPSILSASKSFLPSSPSSPSSINTSRILTLQDDLDLPSLSLPKHQYSGSPRGHNGIRSLERALSTRAFHRLRIGVGRPVDRDQVADWVMGPLGREEVRACEVGGKTCEKAWEEVLRIGWEEEDGR